MSSSAIGFRNGKHLPNNLTHHKLSLRTPMQHPSCLSEGLAKSELMKKGSRLADKVIIVGKLLLWHDSRL